MNRRFASEWQAHYKAGATHVSLTVVPAEGTSLERTILPDEHALEALAPRSLIGFQRPFHRFGWPIE